MKTDGWRLGLLAREALKNVVDARARLMPVLVFAVAAGLGGALFAAYDANMLRHQLATDALRGRNVVEFTAANPKQAIEISRSSCEGLTRLPGVIRAGQLAIVGTINLPQIGADLPIAGASQQLFPALGSYDFLIGSALRGRTSSFELLLPSGEFGRADSSPAQPAGIDVDSDVVTLLPPRVSSSPNCYVVFSQFADAQNEALVASARLRVTGGSVGATRFFVDASNPIAAYHNRATRFLPWLLGFVGGLITGVLTRSRIGELAAYRLSGTSTRSLWVLMLFEQLTLAGAFVASALLGALIVSKYFYSALPFGANILLAASTWIIVAVATSIDIALRAPTSLAKDR